jgi:hypothetical protein
MNTLNETKLNGHDTQNGERPKTTAPDPFDPAQLALGQDFAGAIGVKKLVTTVPVRKPHRHEWIRVHPDAEYRLQTAALPLKFEREEIYLVAQPLWSELPGEVRPIEILTAVNREGVVFLWPLKLPGSDGRLDTWNASAIDAASHARQQWARVAANMALGAYEIHVPTGELSAPAWPTLSLQELLKIGFRDRFIDSIEHPALKRLRGEV